MGLKALSAFLVEQAWRMSPDAKNILTAERVKVANENVPWDVVEQPEVMAAELRELTYHRLGEKVPELGRNEKPTFDAADFLEEEEEAAQVVKNGTKRRSEDTASANKQAKLRHHSAASPSVEAKPQPASTSSSQTRSILPVTTSVTHELRERPKDPTIHFDEDANGDDEKPIMQEAEVKTTTSANMVKKTMAGPEAGSWVVEIRKMTTTIERVYFKPLNEVKAGEENGDTEMNGEQVKPDEALPLNGFIGVHDDIMALINKSETQSGCGSSAIELPKDEITKMLDLADLP